MEPSLPEKTSLEHMMWFQGIEFSKIIMENLKMSLSFQKSIAVKLVMA